MCQNCWEDYGSPLLRTDKVLHLAEIIHEFYLDYPTGGGFHIVLDDWNLDSVEWCIDWCKGEGAYVVAWDEAHEEMAELLLDATQDELASALAISRQYEN